MQANGIVRTERREKLTDPFVGHLPECRQLYSHSVVTIGSKNASELSPDPVAQKSCFLQRMPLYMADITTSLSRIKPKARCVTL